MQRKLTLHLPATGGDLRVALQNFLEQFSRELGGGPFRVPKMWSC